MQFAYQRIHSRLQSKLKTKIDEARHRPISLPKGGNDLTGIEGPKWVFPLKSGGYGYEDFDGHFYLQWQGEEDADYILQYKAGHGDNALEGQLEVHGIKKDFGMLSKRYWQTWIVPASPFKVRVRRSDKGGWSDWLELEAHP